MTDLIPELRTPTAPEGTGRVRAGMPVSRVDGRAKVTGEARYAAEHEAPGLCYGVAVNSTIARGRIVRIDLVDALTGERPERHDGAVRLDPYAAAWLHTAPQPPA